MRYVGTIRVEFEADDAEDARHELERIGGSAIAHPCVLRGATYEPKQGQIETTTTVRS